MMKAYNKSSLLWSASCKALLLLAVFALETSISKAGNQHVFTDTIPIVEQNGLILMPVKINHEIKHLVFDTGASGIVLWGNEKPFITKWIENGTDAKNHTKELESGLVLAEFGSRCDSLVASFKPLPTDSLLRNSLSHLGDGIMGFCPLIRCGLDYFVKVDLRKGIIIVSNNHKLAKQTKGIKVGYKKCDALPTFTVRIGEKNRTRLPFDSGAAHFCSIPTSLSDKWEKNDKNFKACKVFDDYIDDFAALYDTTIYKIRTKAYKCNFAIKSFKVNDVLVLGRPSSDASVGEQIFHKAIISFDPWHRKIIFQPY